MSVISWLSGSFHALVAWLVNVVGSLGYPGIVGLMFLESSFFPFPSEVVIPPAGYLASKGAMNPFAVVVCGIAGSLLGAYFNYYIAVKWGRKFFERFGKYFFVSPSALDKAEAFFARHGHISTFTARLLPVIRQYVSLPAGLARMNLVKFSVYTGLGSGIWVIILTALGYWLGLMGETKYNEEVMYSGLHRITLALAVFCAALIAGYVFFCVRRNRALKKDVS
ncbi:MAG: DedA family protein [Synergistaceae bacterium]|jgi:membrane protein DedA with SNARE-associated domain|nr:DedA family protein [Synergistaceae bacterium]